MSGEHAGEMGMTRVHADDVGEPNRDARVAGVLLAAGSSTRFDGRNKLLVELGDETVVERATRPLLDAACDLAPVVAVVGHDADRVREALSGLPVDVVHNPDHVAGQATSVRAGLAAVGDVDAVVFALGDMPAVAPRTVATLVAAYRADVGTALAAAHGGRRGNPVLFGREHFDELRDVAGDTGGRRILLESDDAALVETDDPGVLVDVDAPGDLEALRDGAHLDGPGDDGS